MQIDVAVTNRRDGFSRQLRNHVRSHANLYRSFVITCILYRLWKRWRRRGRNAPGPHTSLLDPLGSMLAVLKHYGDMPDWYIGLVKEYGKIFRLSIGHVLAPFQTVLVVTTPEGLQHVLKTRFDNYEKGNVLQELMRETFGHGIFGVDGEAWYRQRKTSSQIFSAENMRTEMMTTVTKNVDILIDALRHRSAEGTQPVDVQKVFFDFQMDTFCEIGFGVELGSLGATPVKRYTDFAEAFDALQSLCPERPFRPLWRIQKFLSHFALRGLPLGFLCGTELQIAKYKRCVDDVIRELIEKRRKGGPLALAADENTVFDEDSKAESAPSTPRSGRSRSSSRSRSFSRHEDGKRLDLLELFMDSDPPLSYEELQDVVMSLLVGGRDTTAVTLTWAMYELARNPATLEQVREECAKLQFESVSDLYSALKDMRYLDGVVKETIRLHTPVPIDSKTCLSDDVLPSGHYVGQNWTIIYSPYVMARDVDLWGEDAAKWRPERWLGKSEPSPFVYSAFNAGPRICLGRDLALLEAKAVIALLLKKGVKLELWPTMGEDEPKFIMGVVMKMVEPGLLMRITMEEDAK